MVEGDDGKKLASGSNGPIRILREPLINWQGKIGYSTARSSKEGNQGTLGRIITRCPSQLRRCLLQGLYYSCQCLDLLHELIELLSSDG